MSFWKKWYTIYHPFPVVKGVSEETLYENQPMGKHLWL